MQPQCKDFEQISPSVKQKIVRSQDFKFYVEIYERSSTRVPFVAKNDLERMFGPEVNTGNIGQFFFVRTKGHYNKLNWRDSR